MTPEVIQAFVESGRPVRVVWNDEEESVCSTVALLMAVELCVVTAAGNYIPVHAITSIGRADAPDDDGVGL